MRTNPRGKRPPLPGRLQPSEDDIAAMIRVDHAGEFGALRIYEGASEVLKVVIARSLLGSIARTE